ncbi:hypothetical protein [Croceimicrobium hydrocarbonivorans]|uniref:Uncharacterized protein n=1 Tax=Croceimicrobium hydrocarbonivorans TaxID=2761580 RepID=A0A7H0VDY0_9FLAO|nr:hypothetical protein [Croceimicrobium hydrocarbonivorans]QNR23928.1 hypothetical protein H4K34_16370 [Croceimicrobium hydrocarbonivorans]
MTEDQKYTAKEYRERHRFWADKTLTQFGFANNFFLVVAIGILGFILKELGTNVNIRFTLLDIDWDITLSRLSAILAFMSICCGIITMLSRLFDLRLTRHINTVRIKAYDNAFKMLDDDYISIKGIPIFTTFLDSLTSRYYYIKDSEIKDDRLIKCKFKDLRKRALLLGRLSWKYFYYQLILLIFSVLSFMIAVL